MYCRSVCTSCIKIMVTIIFLQFHREQSKMYVCTICNSFVGQTFSATLRHMGSHHFDPGLLIQCGINSCTEQYKNFGSFRSHVYRKHREVLVSVDGGDSTFAPIENLGMSGVEYQMNSEADGTDSDGDELQTSIQFNDDPERLAALFLLKTREEHKVTQTALNGVVRDFQGIWKDVMERLQVKECILYKCYPI